MNFFQKYSIIAMGINGLFKCYDTYNAKVKRNNYKETDMLFAEKIAIISAHTIGGPYILPASIYNKICLLEVYAKNKNIDDYYPENNRDNTIYSYMFRIL